MNKKRGYIIDSTMTESMEAATEMGVQVVPLDVIIDGKPYKDLVDITINDFYVAMVSGEQTSTSQPSSGAFLEMYEQNKANGVEELFVFALSSALSGTYNSAVAASEMITGIDIYVVDTKLTAAGMLPAIGDIIAYATPDKTASEIIAFAQHIFSQIKIYVYIGDLTALKKGGRLSSAQAMIGNLLRINVVITLDESGAITVLGKERSTKKAVQAVINDVKKSNKKPKRVTFLQTTNQAYLDFGKKIYAEHFSTSYKVCNLSPVVGNHIGTEAAAICVQFDD